MARLTSVVLAVLVAVPGPAGAQQSAAPAASPQATLERCRQLSDGAARLSCYDEAVGALLDGTRAGTVSIVDRNQLREARRSLFGFSMPRLPFFSGDRSAEEQSDELTSAIRSVRAIGGGHYRIVLEDGGAVWETTESYTNFEPPAAGQKVVIKRGSLGSYMLRIDGQRGVKGRRVG